MGIRSYFFKIYFRMQATIAPGLKYSQEIYEGVLSNTCGTQPYWLDLGCGHMLLPSWRFDSEKTLIGSAQFISGIDFELDALKKHGTIKNLVRGDISELPFKDGTYDVITSNMVFEHLKYPDRQLKEIFRVLKPGGRLIFHTPNTLGYSTILARLIPEFIKDKIVFIIHGREEEDVFKAYYKINSPKNIENAAQNTGFRIVSLRLICSSAQLAIFPPLAIFELIWIRLLLKSRFRKFRTNIVATLEKPVER